MEENRRKILWKDRKRWWFGLPWSFTRYRLTEEKLTIETGFFSRRQDEVRLFRVLDVSLRRRFGERLFGLGTIEVASSDRTMGNFEIKRVCLSKEVAETLSDLVDAARRRERVIPRELLSDDDCACEHSHDMH